MAKYIKTEEGYKSVKDIESLDRWYQYDLVVCLCDEGWSVGGISAHKSPYIVKGDYESVKKAFADCGAVMIYLYAYGGSRTQEYRVDGLFLDEDDYFVIDVYKSAASITTARMYLSPKNTVSLKDSEWTS